MGDTPRDTQSQAVNDTGPKENAASAPIKGRDAAPSSSPARVREAGRNIHDPSAVRAGEPSEGPVGTIATHDSARAARTGNDTENTPTHDNIRDARRPGGMLSEG